MLASPVTIDPPNPPIDPSIPFAAMPVAHRRFASRSCSIPRQTDRTDERGSVFDKHFDRRSLEQARLTADWHKCRSVTRSVRRFEPANIRKNLGLLTISVPDRVGHVEHECEHDDRQERQVELEDPDKQKENPRRRELGNHSGISVDSP